MLKLENISIEIDNKPKFKLIGVNCNSVLGMLKYSFESIKIANNKKQHLKRFY